MTKRAFQYASRPCLRLDVGRMRERRNGTIFHFSEPGSTSFCMIIQKKAILMLEIQAQNFDAIFLAEKILKKKSFKPGVSTLPESGNWLRDIQCKVSQQYLKFG